MILYPNIYLCIYYCSCGKLMGDEEKAKYSSEGFRGGPYIEISKY